MSIFDAAMRYGAEGVPLVVLGGREYGSGSSRDWAAKGTQLLGVRAVIAESFERIHRSNLVGMGVLPLVFPEGESGLIEPAGEMWSVVTESPSSARTRAPSKSLSGAGSLGRPSKKGGRRT